MYKPSAACTGCTSLLHACMLVIKSMSGTVEGLGSGLCMRLYHNNAFETSTSVHKKGVCGDDSVLFNLPLYRMENHC